MCPLYCVIYLWKKKYIAQCLMYMHTLPWIPWTCMVGALSWKQKNSKRRRGGEMQKYMWRKKMENVCSGPSTRVGFLSLVHPPLAPPTPPQPLFNSNEFTGYWLLALRGHPWHRLGGRSLSAFLNDANQSGGAWPPSLISFFCNSHVLRTWN